MAGDIKLPFGRGIQFWRMGVSGGAVGDMEKIKKSG
jgi:hypothetical protein